VRFRSGCRFCIFLFAATFAVGLFVDRTASAASGTVHGVVIDPDKRAVPGASVELRNDITGFKAETVTGADGTFRFDNVPYNPYELHVELQGFKTVHQPVDVRSALPVEVNVSLALAELSETVTVTAEATAAQLETTSSVSHVDVDKSYIARAPTAASSRAMEQIVTSTPGFTKDENGRFHFQGSHSQSEYVVDGQTISDQTGVTFSNSIDPGIAESLEIVYGNVPAEYGEKTGAVINIVTKSGLNSPFRGEIYGGAARFSTYEGGVSLGGGSEQLGVFGSVTGSWSDRFLDPVNPDNLHNNGETGRGFLRVDHASADLQSHLRFTALVGTTNRDVPNTYTQESAGQDQRVHSRDQNYSFGWTRAFSERTVIDANGFARLSRFELLPSGSDTPVTATSNRTLNNFGVNVAVTKLKGNHEIKMGGTFKSFPIDEIFGFGITDPEFNDPESEGFNPDLAPYDLTRGGQPLDFRDKRTGNYAGLFLQDNFRYKRLTANLGVRFDHNDLPLKESQVEPRIGLAYYIESSRTVLRGSYNRIFFTPQYENILFSSSSLAATLVPPEIKDSRELGEGVLLVPSERQNAYTIGVQQALGKEARLDVDFWWRRSQNAGDQDQFLNTGVVFPLAFASGRYNGWNLRLDLAQTHDLRGFLSLGHVHAIYVPPPVGGLFLDAEFLDAITGGPFLIDHDQKLQAQGQVFWYLGDSGAWLGANLRYDSGLVTDANPDELLSDPDNAFAAPFIVVHSGTELDPNRIKARTIADVSVGFDLHAQGLPVSIQADLLNAFDEEGAYNILSVFGGTHVIPPRTLAVRVKYGFGGK
jgi:hypothetical protein